MSKMKEAKKKYADGTTYKEEKAGALKDHVASVTRLDQHLKRIKS